MRDRNPSGQWEWIPLHIHAQLAFHQGAWELFLIEIDKGGSRRDLDIELLIDGVPASYTDRSWWEFKDNVIHYVNPDDVHPAPVH